MGQRVLLPVTLVALMVGFGSLVLPALGLFPLHDAGWREMPTVTQEAGILPSSAAGEHTVSCTVSPGPLRGSV